MTGASGKGLGVWLMCGHCWHMTPDWMHWVEPGRCRRYGAGSARRSALT